VVCYLLLMSDSAICTEPLARQTLRVRYFRHYGLPQPPESLSPSVYEALFFCILQAKTDSIPII
jgi:hypothetical protein